MQINIEFSELQTLIKERDEMRDRIAQLEGKPLAFSLQGMANDLANHGAFQGLTPDQRKQLFTAISQYRIA